MEPIPQQNRESSLQDYLASQSGLLEFRFNESSGNLISYGDGSGYTFEPGDIISVHPREGYVACDLESLGQFITDFCDEFVD